MLILTEKPSVAKDIAAALGGFNYQKGYYLQGNNCIVYAAGHLLELFAPDDYDDRYKKWQKADLPIIPPLMKYKPIREHKEQLSIIKNCFDEYGKNGFILATDPEREGELIGALILSYVGFQDWENAKRFWVAEALTPDVVNAGLKKALPLIKYESYKKAGYARQHADWLIGMNITRLLSISNGALFSFGRVQTAVLGAIYLRDKAISDFKAIPYEMFKADCGEFALYLTDSAGNNKFEKNNQLLKIVSESVLPGDAMQITKVSIQQKIEQPPQLFNITGLQKYCSAKYHYSPKFTLQTVQELYEKFKCMSYPRTPSVVLGDDNVNLYQEKFDLLSTAYPEYATGCDITKIVGSNKRLFNSAKLTDHHALIPLAVLPESAAEAQRNIYSAVLERFFTVIKAPFIYNAINVAAVCRTYSFTGSGRQINSLGWKEKEKEKNDDVELFPQLVEGQLCKIIKTEVNEKETQPKKHFTNASILALMENPTGEEGEHLVGIGTPATRADIIATLIEREYIKEVKQNLLITDKGKYLIDTVIKIPALRDFISIKTTTQWEERLESNPDDFLSETKKFLKKIIAETDIDITKKWENAGLGVCPICKKGKILSGKFSYYCSDYKNGCKFSVWKNICHAAITDNDVQLLLTGKNTRTKKMKTKEGKEFSAQLILGSDYKVQFAPYKK